MNNKTACDFLYLLLNRMFVLPLLIVTAFFMPAHQSMAGGKYFGYKSQISLGLKMLSRQGGSHENRLFSPRSLHQALECLRVRAVGSAHTELGHLLGVDGVQGLGYPDDLGYMSGDYRTANCVVVHGATVTPGYVEELANMNTAVFDNVPLRGHGRQSVAKRINLFVCESTGGMISQCIDESAFSHSPGGMLLLNTLCFTGGWRGGFRSHQGVFRASKKVHPSSVHRVMGTVRDSYDPNDVIARFPSSQQETEQCAEEIEGDDSEARRVMGTVRDSYDPNDVVATFPSTGNMPECYEDELREVPCAKISEEDDASTLVTEMITSSDGYGYLYSRGWHAIVVDLMRSQLEFVAMLPPVGEHPEDITEELATWLFGTSMGTATETTGLTMPVFNIEDQQNLAPLLAGCGIPSIFSYSEANFQNVLAYPADPAVNSVMQRNLVRLDAEKDVSSVANRSLRPLPPPSQHLVLDTPFLFFIRHRIVGSILLMGVLNNPFAKSNLW